VHYWSLKRKIIIIRAIIHRRLDPADANRNSGYRGFVFFLSELDKMDIRINSCFRSIKFVLYLLKYIVSQIEVCAFSQSRVFIWISSHNFQIFNNMLIQCKVPISSFKPIQKRKYEARALSTAFWVKSNEFKKNTFSNRSYPV
jgi:hypothetical protein